MARYYEMEQAGEHARWWYGTESERQQVERILAGQDRSFLQRVDGVRYPRRWLAPINQRDAVERGVIDRAWIMAEFIVEHAKRRSRLRLP